MSVFRVKHNSNYVCINKLALEDPNLSLKAKGLWAYCMSRPDNWTFRICHLQSIMKEGRDSIRAAMKELIERGYCIRVTLKNSTGRFSAIEYQIYEVPQSKEDTTEIKEKFPETCYQAPANTTLLSNDSTKYISPPPNVVSQAQQHSPVPHKSNADVVVKLKKSFKKSLKGKEIDRAIAYYLSHPKEISLADNPIGFVVYMVRNNLDFEDLTKKTIIQARKQWAKDHEYTCQAGSAIAQNKAYSVTNGGICCEHPYDKPDPFWERQGLGFPV